jgi:hypothetical protein
LRRHVITTSLNAPSLSGFLGGSFCITIKHGFSRLAGDATFIRLSASSLDARRIIAGVTPLAFIRKYAAIQVA